MSKTIIAVRHFGLGGRESLETAVKFISLIILLGEVRKFLGEVLKISGEVRAVQAPVISPPAPTVAQKGHRRKQNKCC